jgi:predicted acetyltransferase
MTGVQFGVPSSREEAAETIRAAGLAFGDDTDAEEVERLLRVIEPERMLLGRDDGTIVATAGAFTFDLTVPGGRAPTAGVTGVGVLPSHRRRGLLTAMMRRQLGEIRERGEPLATLHASEAGIYGRFGYGMAALSAVIDADRDRAVFRVPPVSATARLLDEAAALDRLPAVYDRVADVVPGMYRRSRTWWESYTLDDSESARRGAGPLFRALVELDDGEAGYTLYRVRGHWENGFPAGAVEVREAMGTSPAAEREVWRYLFNVDLTAFVRGWMLPADTPLPHLVVEPARLRFRLRDALWLRVVDVERAFAARRYAAEAEVVVELRDDFCTWNAGRWLLSAAGATRTGRPAELALDVQELASLYLGGFTATALARAGLVEELAPDALARADALLSWPRAPWLPEIF